MLKLENGLQRHEIFKHNVLNNKAMSKAYDIYDQLSSPQGLTEQDAKEEQSKSIQFIRFPCARHRIRDAVENQRLINNFVL